MERRSEGSGRDMEKGRTTSFVIQCQEPMEEISIGSFTGHFVLTFASENHHIYRHQQQSL